MGFLDRKSIIYLTLIVALSVALIAVCIDAYGGGTNDTGNPKTDAQKLNCEKASVTTATGSFVDRKAFCPGELIFEDNFDELNMDKWQHEHTLGGGGNGEFQYYLNHRDNSFVEDGILYIKPSFIGLEPGGEEYLKSGTLDINGGDPGNYCTNPSWNGCVRTGTPESILNPVKSARIRTANSFSFKYGKLEIRAKLPSGDWMWPALWLMPRVNQYGTWPASGEIDIMEARCNPNYFDESGVHIGTEQVLTTLHFGPNAWTNAYYTSTEPRNSASGQGFDKDFHLYQMEWTPDFMKISVDNEQLMLVEGNFWKRGNFDELAPGTRNPWISGTKMAPFDQEFFIIINLAIGGTQGYFPDEKYSNPKPKPWRNWTPVGEAMKAFWDKRDDWLPSWNIDENDGKDASFQIDYVKVWAL
ncbi:beta-1,3-glucan-binding protein-like [Uranotaenia lowii]|uniref:beta-1,3-glucan-binding protein-like n=1 Tax=Uranotaenia lowii TaxID=190385 RepID=UPI00247A81BF|nr:beta-1,3-glucan-binding protein-like [Uranotaenia lowii]